MIKRINRIEDVNMEDMERMGKRFCRLADHGGGFVLNTFCRTWDVLIRWGMGAMWVWEEDGRLKGAIGAICHPDMCDGSLSVNEAFWFVDEAHRGGIGGIRLLRAVEDYAVSIGAKRILMGKIAQNTGIDMDRLYDRLGYKPVETTFIKQL